MKKFLVSFLLTSAIAIPNLKAENLPTPIIGIVEQATLDRSDALKSIISQVEKKRNEIQKEMTTYETQLKEEDKKLAEEQKKLSEKEFTTKRQAFERKVHEVQEKLELRRVQMELAVEEAKKKVLEVFLKVADEVKNEVGANIVIYKETIVTADNSFDLSTQVLERLNKTLPTVQVTYKPESEIKQQLMQQLQPQQK